MTEDQLKQEAHESATLAKHMEATGDPRPNSYCHAHAIISGAHTKAAPLRAVMAFHKCRIDDSINGCWLASDTKAKMLVPNWLKNGIAHSRIHRHNYYFWLKGIINLDLIINDQKLVEILRIVEFRLQTSSFPDYVTGRPRVMTIERIHQDERYLTYMLDSSSTAEYMEIHHSTHDLATPALYGTAWKSLKIKFLDMGENGTTEVPDLSFDGSRLFLNKNAYKVLKTILNDHGEFLPVCYEDCNGYFFNALKVAESMDALIENLVGFDRHGNLEHFSFDEKKINKTPLFKAEIDNYHGLFCTTEFIDIVTDAKLTGLNFYPDVSNVIGGAYPIMQ